MNTQDKNQKSASELQQFAQVIQAIHEFVDFLRNSKDVHIVNETCGELNDFELNTLQSEFIKSLTLKKLELPPEPDDADKYEHRDD
jgi:hypothetical protein